MNTIILNHELKAVIPDGFHEMDEAERGNLNFYNEVPALCVCDPDRHIILSAAWKKQALASMLLSSREIAEKMEKSFRKPMEPFGYRLEEFLEESIDGVAADGFRYSYTAEGVGMTGESFSFKKGKTFYYIHAYARTDLLDESLPVLRGILRSWEWV